jgi:transcriptional regulator GlxA family with amidase domain
MTRKLAIVIFPDFQILDATGPIAAFEIAGRLAPDAYAMTVMAASGGEVTSSSGVRLVAQPLDEAAYDTLLIAGGNGSRDFEGLAPTLAWLARRAGTVRRVASVCSGAYLLAEAGLLDGKRATTHWGRSDHFARRYPKVRLEPDRIFVREGEIWTSAGITAGIDLALAMIEDDLGCGISRQTAQNLVVHQRRPGGQSQFSALLEIGGHNGRFAELMDWMRERLCEPLGVERLADESAPLRPRLHRRDRRDTGEGRRAPAP